MKPEDIADLKQLIEFLKEHQVAEFDLDRGDLKIRLKFNPHYAEPTGLGDLARLVGSAPHGSSRSESTAAAASVAAPEAVAEAADERLHLVKSPIVGTYYGSPSPGSGAFVAPGDRVEKGQVICIIEAMKLMNEIECDVAGQVVKCLVADGQAIEFGQPLFSVRV